MLFLSCTLCEGTPPVQRGRLCRAWKPLILADSWELRCSGCQLVSPSPRAYVLAAQKTYHAHMSSLECVEHGTSPLRASRLHKDGPRQAFLKRGNCAAHPRKPPEASSQKPASISRPETATSALKDCASARTSPGVGAHPVPQLVPAKLVGGCGGGYWRFTIL